MAESLIDGTGSGYQAKVGLNNRLWTYSISESITEAAAEEGDSYNFNTGTINLTSATESGLAYFKNNGDKDIAIVSIGFLIGNSTGGTGDSLIKIYKNPTGGTLISAATDVSIFINKNFGSSKSLTADAYKGIEGSTITGGTDAYYSLLSGVARTYAISTGSIVLPKGSSIAISFTPQSSNTSTDIQVFMSLIEISEAS